MSTCLIVHSDSAGEMTDVVHAAGMHLAAGSCTSLPWVCTSSVR